MEAFFSGIDKVKMECDLKNVFHVSELDNT